MDDDGHYLPLIFCLCSCVGLCLSRVVVAPFQIFGHAEVVTRLMLSFLFSVQFYCATAFYRRFSSVCEIFCPEGVSGCRFEAGVMEW